MSDNLKRRATLLAGPLAIAAVAAYFYIVGGRYMETDNAYLKAGMLSIASEISGKVVEVSVADNGRVEAGQLLFRVDDQPYQIALARAEANLIKVGGDVESLKADYLNKLADLEQSKTQHDFYLREFNRLNSLLARKTVSAAEVDQAEYLYLDSINEMQVTTQALQVVKARLIDIDLPLQQHPSYLLALAERDKARLDLSHVRIVAPSSGVVANFSIHKGEYIIAGAPLFSLVDDSYIWVEANFKETDLTHLQVGQPATIEVDAYPDQQWQGHVSSITPGTGSEFSLLPAQNSTGNWVKVVQRITVNLAIDTASDSIASGSIASGSSTPSSSISGIALTAGMSALVKVDTGHSRQLPWAN
ncbi:putative multidrag resistance protein [marine gamma proteobacterium HTCC2207]|uniref:Putative multidrag resistance protein n=1 Tax=gamma proteobacterium HTCC2207 TaxID=314287 RepID=Q1YU95_9GAMM|nr:putative multidrag resistance protein [marine gamma proteobacterium HTCC2207] [gamma proteobacterium HTCC2207]MDG1081538.1 HlyD family secretion protein [Porticoccaceae bacterium]